MNHLYAHHKVKEHGNAGGNGNGKGNGNNVPEIDGETLPLSLVLVVLFWLLLKCFRKST